MNLLNLLNLLNLPWDSKIVILDQRWTFFVKSVIFQKKNSFGLLHLSNPNLLPEISQNRQTFQRYKNRHFGPRMGIFRKIGHFSEKKILSVFYIYQPLTCCPKSAKTVKWFPRFKNREFWDGFAQIWAKRDFENRFSMFIEP